MDDLLKVFLYILVVVIYALLKMKKKDPAKQQKQPHQTPKQPLPHTTPTRSFADAPPKKASGSLEKTIKNLDKEIKKSKQIIKPGKHIQSGKVYEEKSFETGERRSLEREPLTYESPARDYQSHFDKFETFSEIQNYESAFQDKNIVFEYPDEDSKRVNPYSEFLKDPENVKKAFVLKEIFDRKHF